MKFNKSGQLFLVSAAALLVSGLLSACLGTSTADFIFVACNKAAGPNSYGEIDVMEVNNQAGTMRQIPTSPFPSQGRNPVAEVVSPDHNYLYVINQDDNDIVQFLIGSDGKLYGQSTVNVPGLAPVAVAMDPGQNFLYVLSTFQPLANCSSAAPCAGSISVFPIFPGTPGNISTSSLAAANGICPNAPSGAPSCNGGPVTTYALNLGSDVVAPQGIAVLANGTNLYVTAQDSTNGTGYIFNFIASSGVLTPNSSQSLISTGSGTLPAAITSNGSSTIFVADSVNLAFAPAGNIFSYTINANGSLAFGGSFAAGNTPVALALDPTGKYLYAANQVDSNVTAFTVSGASLTNIGSYGTGGTQPSAIIVDPDLGQFVYVTNFLGNDEGLGNVAGFELNPANGALTNAVNTPFKANPQPVAMAAVPHKY